MPDDLIDRMHSSQAIFGLITEVGDLREKACLVRSDYLSD